MKKIAFFDDGSIGVIDTDSKLSIKINGQPPSAFEPVTGENIRKHFKKDIEIPDGTTKVKHEKPLEKQKEKPQNK